MSTITADNRVTQAVRPRSDLIRKLFEWGGFAAGAVLGIVDGATAWFTPAARPMIAGRPLR